MTLKHFIDRPVLAAVISIVIVLGGIIGVATLPVEQYPDIAPPTVMVRASYPGASAETIQKSVIIPLEEAINGVENMMYIKSEASNAGSGSITVYFKQGTNADMAAVNVQNKVATATGSLPAEVTKIGVTTMKRQSSMLKVFTLSSPDDSYDENFLSNYLNINIKPRIQRIQGVGEFFALGGDYAMRIWMKPDVMAQYKLIPSDITGVLAEQNIESAAGMFGENSDNTFQYTMKYRGRKMTPEEFGEIVIRATSDGQVLRLKDVADIELGQDSYAYHGMVNGHPGVSALVFQTAGTNATQTVEEIDAMLDEIATELPKGVEITHLMSVNDYLYASIHEVIKTLIEAIILVILVVYVFLQDIRSTLIPTISILVSLVGTFAFLSFAGFSINLLTLFALVLAIGTVVDDAIIVVEAVQARFDSGYKSSYLATVDAMGGITSAIITSTLVFMAVFIPVSMMGGTSGTFYTQFGITMAVAVGISALNALTLSPALCALLLKPYVDEDGNVKNNFAARFRKAYNTAFSAVLKKYQRGVMVFIKHKWLTWATLGLAMIGLVLLMNNTKTGLVPDEDQGTIMINVTTAPGSSLAETNKIMGKVGERLKSIPQIRDFQQVAGYGMIAGQGNSYGMCIVRLKDWSERPDKADAECRNRPNLCPDRRHQGRADLRRRSPDDHRLRYFDRFRNVSARPDGRRHNGLLQHLFAIHLCAQPTAGNPDGLFDLQHQLPAVYGGHRCGEGQARGYLSDRDSFDPFGLLRRTVRVEHQPLLESISRDDPGRSEIPTRSRIAQQRVRADAERRNGTDQSVRQAHQGIWIGGIEPLQHV